MGTPDCWALGCGLTGWIQAAGTYVLEFGVSNANDELYDTGLAFAGVEVGGSPVPGVPESPSMALLGAGLRNGCSIVGAEEVRRRCSARTAME